MHLVYVPLGAKLFQRFLDSYLKHPAGIEHKLVIMFNGFAEEKELSPFFEIINSLDLEYETILSAEKYDLGSYFSAARKLDSEYLLFLNSYSIILADDWLRFYYSAIRQPNVGVVGSSGGGWRSEFKRFRENAKYSFLENPKPFVFMRINFGKFRGKHLRTNAFMVKRELFLSLTYHKLSPAFLPNHSAKETKAKTLYFEHGNQSMTYQIAKKGLKAIIVDKYGNTHEPENWCQAKTFWISNQENLLIHDNQTLRYETGDEQVRKELSFWAWGA